MKYKRLFASPDGESHFEDVEVIFSADPGRFGKAHRSETLKSASAYFGEIEVGFEAPWHTNPEKALFSFISGKLELTASDGTRFCSSPGDIISLEDTTGKGHYGRNIGNEPVRYFSTTIE